MHVHKVRFSWVIAVLLGTLSFYLSSCGSSEPKPYQVSKEIVDEVADSLGKTYGLELYPSHESQTDRSARSGSNTGGGQTGVVRAHFRTDRRIEFEDAVDWFEGIADQMAQMINERAQAEEPGFVLPLRKIDLSIEFRDENDHYVERPYLAYMYLADGTIYFHTYDVDKKKLKRLHRLDYQPEWAQPKHAP